MRTEFLCVPVLRVASGPRVKLARCKSALNPTVVLVWICRFPLPHDILEGLRFVIVALSGLFSYLFLLC